MGTRFNHLNVPDHWNQYWTKYPEGYTILEALLNWVASVDNLVDNVNNWNSYLDDFVKTFDKNLQETVINILRKWQEDGTLKIIIDEALQTQIDTKVTKGELITSVTEFGVKGDGTDETSKIQKAIDATPENGVLYFPPPKVKYFCNSYLTVPDGKHFMTFKGAGKHNTLLEFASKLGFSIKSENISFESMKIKGSGINNGGTLFRDERPNNRADFDFNMNSCYISSVETVIETRGRGVVIDNGCVFYEIRSHIIKANFPDSLIFEEGPEDIHKYQTGFRGFIFRGNRVHYSPCMIINNKGGNKANLTGIMITDNQLEGSTGYIEGDANDLTVKGNIHYQSGNVRGALFLLDNVRNADIDLVVSGMKKTTQGYEKYFNKLIRVNGYYENVKIRATVQDVDQHVIELVNGGKNIDIEINANNICHQNPTDYNVVKFDGTTAHEGVNIKANVNSPGSDFTAIFRNTATPVRDYVLDVTVTGTYKQMHNLNPSERGKRQPLIGRFTGSGGTQTIDVKYPPQMVQVWTNEPESEGVKQAGSSWLSPDITLTNTGFTVTGKLDLSGKIYSYLVF